jgi:hypothetical protein
MLYTNVNAFNNNSIVRKKRNFNISAFVGFIVWTVY